jgi:hypothetical protein
VCIFDGWTRNTVSSLSLRCLLAESSLLICQSVACLLVDNKTKIIFLKANFKKRPQMLVFIILIFVFWCYVEVLSVSFESHSWLLCSDWYSFAPFSSFIDVEIRSLLDFYIRKLNRKIFQRLILSSVFWNLKLDGYSRFDHWQSQWKVKNLVLI